MKKILSKLSLATAAALIACAAYGTAPKVYAAEDAAGSNTEILEGWTVPAGYEGRVSVKKEKEGIVIRQLVQGTPSSHAVAISPAVEGTSGFEVVLNIRSEEYAESGKLANDVWTGVGFMGKPVFINWRNNEASGYAKDSPGLFSRFFNIAGEFAFTTDVYCKDFIKDLEHPDDPGSIVDTWTLMSKKNAQSQEGKDMRVALRFENGEYNFYVNGNKMNTAGELTAVEAAKVFPDGKIYLEIAMNTQKKETNENTVVVIKEMNGVSYAEGTAGESNPSTTSGKEDKKQGCGSSLAGDAFAAVFALAGLALAAKKGKSL